MIRKKLKIILSGILIVLVTTSVTLLPSSDMEVSAATKARTLKELRAELAELKADYKKNESNKAATKNEINNAESSVTNKRNEISTNQNKIESATKESEALELEIAQGKEEIGNLMQAYQYANGDNVYLEYIFEADTYENLIYRYAIVEELMEYQEEKITEWKDKIEANEALKNELKKREEQLNTQIDALSKEISSLGNKLDEFIDIQMDIDKDIEATEELIEYYEDIGCTETEDLEACVNVKGDTMFRKPLTKGRITSYFGYRNDPFTGKKSFHSGTDIGGNTEGTNVYSIANGTVAKIIKKSSCGGNQVYVHHVINGKKYTSAYLHLLNIKVKVGDKVNNNTVVGTVGGGKGTKSWDKCSTGAHLHLGLGTGWYGSDYTSYSKWVSHLINAKDALDLPSKPKYWYSR